MAFDTAQVDKHVVAHDISSMRASECQMTVSSYQANKILTQTRASTLF